MRALALSLSTSLLVFCFGLPPPAAHSADRETQVAAIATAETLRADAAQLLREIPLQFLLEKPKPEAIPQTLTVRAVQIRERVTAALNDARKRETTAGLPSGWGHAVTDSFRASIVLEWRTFAEAETRLNDWCKLIASLRGPDGKETFAWLSLKLTEDVISTWMRAEPEACSRLIDATETTFQPMRDPTMRDAWVWSMPNYNLALRSIAETLPEARRSPLIAKVQERTQSYWNDEKIPLDRRTRSVARTVNSYYSATDIASASALLEQWEKKHPEALQDSFWLVQRYFVASIGESDQRKAAETFRLLERMILRGSLDPASDLFKHVSQNYYRSLPEPALLRQSKARTILRRRGEELSNAPKP